MVSIETHSGSWHCPSCGETLFYRRDNLGRPPGDREQTAASGQREGRSGPRQGSIRYELRGVSCDQWAGRQGRPRSERRSEERRVGKECRSRSSREQYREKDEAASTVTVG